MKKADPSTVPKDDQSPSSQRPLLLRVNHHGRQGKTGCQIVALAEPPNYVRIYLPGEKVPPQLRPFCRTHQLRRYQEISSEGQSLPDRPARYSFTPFPGLTVLIDPLEPAFFIQKENAEHRVTRDESSRLVLA